MRFLLSSIRASVPVLCVLTLVLALRIGSFAQGPGQPSRFVPPEQRQRQMKIFMNFAAADYVVQTIRALPLYRDHYPVEMQAISRDNSIIATGTDESLRELKQAINLLDVDRKIVSLKAEAILVLSDKAGHKHRAVLSSYSLTTGEKPAHLKSSVDGGPASPTEISLTNGMSDVRVQARINGDNSISLDGEWEFDFTFRVPGQTKPLRMHNTSAANGRAKSGDTVSVSGSINKAGGDKNEIDAEILLFLTPNIQRSADAGVRNASLQRRNFRP